MCLWDPPVYGAPGPLVMARRPLHLLGPHHQGPSQAPPPPVPWDATSPYASTNATNQCAHAIEKLKPLWEETYKMPTFLRQPYLL